MNDNDILHDIERRLMEPPTERTLMCNACAGTGWDTNDETDCDCACHPAQMIGTCAQCGASHRCPMCHGAREVPEPLTRPDDYEPD